MQKALTQRISQKHKIKLDHTNLQSFLIINKHAGNSLQQSIKKFINQHISEVVDSIFKQDIQILAKITEQIIRR